MVTGRALPHFDDTGSLLSSVVPVGSIFIGPALSSHSDAGYLSRTKGHRAPPATPTRILAMRDAAGRRQPLARLAREFHREAEARAEIFSFATL